MSIVKNQRQALFMNEIPVSVMWWLTVGAYGVTAVFCLAAAVRQTKSWPTFRRNFWFGMSLGMLLLGVNKLQNLTGILTRQLRGQAYQEDWYFARQPVQLAIITAVAFIFVLLFLWLARKIKIRTNWQKTALLGIVFLTGFAFIRAVSLHFIDILLYRRIGGIQINWVVELGGIALVALPALFQLTQKQQIKEVS
jgi:hypothetical protein